jgi:hypothetical protein
MQGATLAWFEKELRTLIGYDKQLRPFVYEGSPLDCQVFIVGSNPATEMSRPFWDFWQSGYGFRKSEWLEVYKHERKTGPPRPDKTRRAEMSNTRRVVEWILEAAAPVRCLETNVYATPSAESRELGEAQRVTEPFDFLLDTIRPKAILVHGKDAVEHLSPRIPGLIGQRTYVLATPSLSRGWSQERARQMGNALRAVVTTG